MKEAASTGPVEEKNDNRGPLARGGLYLSGSRQF